MSIPWFGPYATELKADGNEQQASKSELRETQQREREILLSICHCFFDELKGRLEDIDVVQKSGFAVMRHKVDTRHAAMLKHFEELAVVDEEVSSLR